MGRADTALAMLRKMDAPETDAFAKWLNDKRGQR